MLRFRDARIVLPTFAELAEPWRIPAAIGEAVRADERVAVIFTGSRG